MRRQHQAGYGQHSRRDVRVRVFGWEASVAIAHVGVAAMLGTLSTAKINPCWVSGGLQTEGIP